MILSERSQEQLEDILRRKRSMTLTLKRALPASPDDISWDSEDVTSAGAKSRKQNIAAALSLPYSDAPSSIDTAETFHTAAADSPEVRMKFPEENVKGQTSEAEEKTVDEETSSKDEDESRSSGLSVLNQRISQQKMLVMRCLKDGTPSREELNRQIDALQELHREQIELEVALLDQERRGKSADSQRDSESTNGKTISEDGAEYFCDRPSMPGSRLRLFKRIRSDSEADEESGSRVNVPRNSEGRGFSSVYITVS